MKQFMAGDIGPGEMGCGIELMVLLTNGDHENTKYYIYLDRTTKDNQWDVILHFNPIIFQSITLLY